MANGGSQDNIARACQRLRPKRVVDIRAHVRSCYCRNVVLFACVQRLAEVSRSSLERRDKQGECQIHCQYFKSKCNSTSVQEGYWNPITQKDTRTECNIFQSHTCISK
eukprot:5150107-Amphidinium_carterae.1